MASHQQIDIPFLEDALKESITGFTVGEGCKVGDNIAGSLKSITVTTVSGKQKHLVYKSFPENMMEENAFVVFMKAFWREHAIYKTIFPEFEKFAKTHGLDYTAPIPKYYKGHNDDKSDYILLEDVRPNGYIMPNKEISLTLEEMSLTAKELAKFHAIGYAYIRHEGERIFKEENGYQFLVQDPALKEMLETQFTGVQILFYNTAAKVLEERFPEGAQKMRTYMAKNGKLEFVREHLTDHAYFPTICHFDLWSNNMLIKHDAQGNPEAVKFIDFQFTQRGNVFSDLYYTLYTSTTPEFRKRHLNTVLNLYYDELNAALGKMNVVLPWGFTRGFFIDNFYAGIGSAFQRMTFAVPLQLGLIPPKAEENKGGPGHTEESILTMYQRSPAAVQRLEDLVKEMIECKIFT